MKTQMNFDPDVIKAKERHERMMNMTHDSNMDEHRRLLNNYSILTETKIYTNNAFAQGDGEVDIF